MSPGKAAGSSGGATKEVVSDAPTKTHVAKKKSAAKKATPVKIAGEKKKRSKSVG